MSDTPATRASDAPCAPHGPTGGHGDGEASTGPTAAHMAAHLTEDERLDLIDRLPADMNIWADDDELETFTDRDRIWWAATLGHPRAHPGCCKTCGCGTVCLFAAHHEALIATVVRELDKLGALRTPKESGHA
ncbi:hypothetical protein [Actinomadura luteofluorescens]|uniref:hypothetical protein n=1 Tax=Actinomadura luteofluorescens TaxID=46163 RepID=UPI003D8A48A6